jgi:hypothetical protein
MHIDPVGPFLDHFFKQTREHHVRLSSQADTKANMMMTVASLVVTLSAGYLTEPALQWAALAMILCCMLSILCAVLAVMPRLPKRSMRNKKPDVNSQAFNILFFGSFISLSYDEYMAEMERVCNDPDKVFASMCKELYGLGIFLAKTKYRYLRWSYQFFLTGMFASVVIVIITELLSYAGRPVATFFVPGVQ